MGALVKLVDEGKRSFRKHEYSPLGNGAEEYKETCLFLLSRSGYIECLTPPEFEVTKRGLDAIKQWKILDLEEGVAVAQTIARSAYQKVEEAQAKLFSFCEQIANNS